MTETQEERPQLPDGIRAAAHAFAEYQLQAEIVVHTTHDGFYRIQSLPNILSALAAGAENPDQAVKDQERIAEAKRKAEYATREMEAGFPLVHAHSLMGLWGALESFVEDIFVAMLEAEPALLSSEAFRKIRIPASVIAPGMERERYRVVLTEATRLANADLGSGVGRFDRLLAMVGLDGAVPRPIRDAIYNAQQVRNVWAHRGGVADPRFLEKCPGWQYVEGDRVDLAPDRFLLLMHGVHMYGLVIVNRYRVHFGQSYLVSECPGYEGVLTGTAASAP